MQPLQSLVMRRRAALCACGAMLAGGMLAACGAVRRDPASSDPAATIAATETVTVTVNAQGEFAPGVVEIVRGQAIRWTNTGTIPQSVTTETRNATRMDDSPVPPGDTPFDSGTLNGGDTFRRIFPVVGNYRYVSIASRGRGVVYKIVVR